ncbi:histidine kinase [Actinoplanes sp. NPDC051851]|uniref:sensor histidine kinase n=1 Tax=Actinoplanes sp. NPDC051851 TaxID=3154753 RepID=UPI0034292DED
MPAWNVDEWRRPGPTDRQRRTDLGIGVALAALAVLNLYVLRSTGYLAGESAPRVPEQILWAVATTLPLAWRRRAPEAVAVVISVFFIAGQVRGTQEQQVTSAVLFAAIYTLGAWGPGRQRARTIRLAIIAAMFAWLTISFVRSHAEITITDASGELPALWSLVFNLYLQNAVFFAFVYLMGDAAWRGVWREHRLAEQADELRAAQAVAAEQAVLQERVRIARELHDVVAHHVSVMGIQASACRRAMVKDPPRAVIALTAVEEGARTAVDELRRMLGALRATGEPHDLGEAVAGIDRLAEITERAAEAGLTVQFGVYGDPVPLPDSVSRAAYRIVQEAVTNTLKHARAGSLDVRVRYLAGELELDVADDGRGPAGGPGGMGLIGMRERITVHDGTLEHGARSGGGFRVRARLPYAAGVAA